MINPMIIATGKVLVWNLGSSWLAVKANCKIGLCLLLSTTCYNPSSTFLQYPNHTLSDRMCSLHTHYQCVVSSYNRRRGSNTTRKPLRCGGPLGRAGHSVGAPDGRGSMVGFLQEWVERSETHKEQSSQYHSILCTSGSEGSWALVCLLAEQGINSARVEGSTPHWAHP